MMVTQWLDFDPREEHVLTPTGGDMELPGPDGGAWLLTAATGAPIVWSTLEETEHRHRMNELRRLQRELDERRDEEAGPEVGLGFCLTHLPRDWPHTQRESCDGWAAPTTDKPWAPLDRGIIPHGGDITLKASETGGDIGRCGFPGCYLTARHRHPGAHRGDTVTVGPALGTCLAYDHVGFNMVKQHERGPACRNWKPL